MTAGNDEIEPLLPLTCVAPHRQLETHPLEHHHSESQRYTSDPVTFTLPAGLSFHSFGFASLNSPLRANTSPVKPIRNGSYGSVRATVVPVATPSLRLTYTWSGLNVFTEDDQARSLDLKRIWRGLKDRVRGRHPPKAELKQLLHNVSGIAEPGELLAILGSSGAGKTTLLNALAFQCNGSGGGPRVMEGGVRALNGVPVEGPDMRPLCAYVQQDDLFIGSLTPREHLIFQALVRMDRHTPYKKRLQRVDEVISELSLGKCQHTIIGVPGKVKGLSGGEMKRLSFASEVLTDPPLLLCDEPTSGLDSFMAGNVLQVLKKLARQGKTVVVTIHQPSSELFAQFDKLLLMAEGRVAFLGTPVDAEEFFEKHGSPCPPHFNPADLYIQVLAVTPTKGVQSKEHVLQLCQAFSDSPAGEEMERKSRAHLQKRGYDNTPDWLAGGINGGYKASWGGQFKAVLWRSWLSLIKEPRLVKVRIFQTIMVALLIGIIYYGQKLDQDGVMNINGLLFIFLTNMTFQNVFAVINVFCGELQVFMREYRANMYRCDVYFLGKTISELPLFCLAPAIFTFIAYPLAMPHPIHAAALATTTGIVILVANVATSFGYLISCVSSSVSMALSIGPPVVIPFLLFGGFFLNTGSVPIYFTWLSYLSWFRYGNEALLVTQWSMVADGEIECTTNNATCPRSGHIVLETLNFKEEDFPLDILGLCFLLLGFRLLAYFALCWRTRA